MIRTLVNSTRNQAFNHRVWLFAQVLLVFLGPSLNSARADDARNDFTQAVRPILSDHCFGCHGPAVQEAELRLDTFDGATDWAITPGDSTGSEVIARVLLADDDELRMPPGHSGKERLTPEEVETLSQWIDAGATYEEHWAFAALERPQTPEVSEDANAIDRFVKRRLVLEGLRFQPEADRNTLARRVTFDLTGLPPTAEEVKKYANDLEDGAYERLVDRLLASPRYGEHLARYWLDAVRYADTHGKHFDNYREIWPYRDWVVRALNDNKPYDEFIVEQLAGDLLPNPTTDQLIATGFNRCNLTTNEGGSIKEEVLTDNVRDRTDAYGTIVLGLTVACAKCHDHKFDPIKQKDYYSLFAFFNSLDGGPMDQNIKNHAPSLSVPTEQQTTEIAELRADLGELEQALVADEPQLDAVQANWEQSLAGLSDPSIRATLLSGPMVTVSDWLQVGPFAYGNENYVRNRKAPPEQSPFDRNKTWRKQDLSPMGWRRRGDLIDGVGHRLGLPRNNATILRRTLTVEEPTDLEVALGSDDTLRVYLNRKVVHEHKRERPLSIGSDRVELKLQAGENELLVRVGNYGGESGFSFQTLNATTLPKGLLAAVAVERDERTVEQRKFLRRAFRERYDSPSLVELRAQIVDAEAKLAQLESEIATTLVFRERAKPRDAFVLVRGDYDNEGELVERDTPGFLPPMSGDLPRNRLGLARWSVAKDNPLTARVAVNRLWQMLFGVGLVKTADDFGSQAEPPSHPELLDWLATDFVDSGWDIKRMMKQLVMSRAYRQSSAANPELWTRDPDNRLLARGPRFRLDAEQLRDQALAVSGLLVNRLGGPPVRPPQPDGLWSAVAYEESNTNKFVADTSAEKVHRRSLYTFHKRTSPPPQMSVLDGPTREACTVRRERTNTPLQALMLMNDPQYVEAARALAMRVLGEVEGDLEARAAWLIELATQRPATDVEVNELAQAVKEEQARFQSSEVDAAKLLATGDAPIDQNVAQADLAAWTMAANLVLNLDEVLSKN